jgi:acetyl-CoA acetyltransferase family protein
VPSAHIVAAARTPIAIAHKGSLRNIDAHGLTGHVLSALIERSGIFPDVVEELMWAEVYQGGGVIGRYSALDAGLFSVPATALNRHCASSLAAIQLAAAQVSSGMADVVIAGGAESVSNRPTLTRRQPGTELSADWYSPTHPSSPKAPDRDMSITVGWNTAQQFNLTREEMDEWAVRSHQRAAAARDRGDFVSEIAPVSTGTDASSLVFAEDETIRADTSVERLAKLVPLHPEIEHFSITAGNSCGINDGAAAVVIASDDALGRYGLNPLATLDSWTSVGVTPQHTGTAPVVAIERAAARAKWNIDQLDLLEVNEAFAAVPMAVTRSLGLDEDRVNPYGSGCSLGHPTAATGARMVCSMVHELRRRGGGRAVVAMCAGGGMGSALTVHA